MPRKITVVELAEIIDKNDLHQLLQTKTTKRIAIELGICRNSLYKLRVLHGLPIIKKELSV